MEQIIIFKFLVVISEKRKKFNNFNDPHSFQTFFWDFKNPKERVLRNPVFHIILCMVRAKVINSLVWDLMTPPPKGVENVKIRVPTGL